MPFKRRALSRFYICNPLIAKHSPFVFPFPSRPAEAPALRQSGSSAVFFHLSSTIPCDCCPVDLFRSFLRNKRAKAKNREIPKKCGFMLRVLCEYPRSKHFKAFNMSMFNDSNKSEREAALGHGALYADFRNHYPKPFWRRGNHTFDK